VTGTAVQTWDLSAIPRSVRISSGFTRSFIVFARPLTAGLTDVSATVAFVNDVFGVPSELALTITAGAPADELALDVWCLHSIIGAVSEDSKAYFFAPGGGGGAVTSVFGRVGAVVAAIGDYLASQVTDNSGVGGADVAASLDILYALIANLTSDDVANASNLNGGAGAVTDALNELQTGWGWFEAETNGNDSGHRIRNVGASGNFDFNFICPPDFGTLTRLEMWGASRTVTNPAAPITLTSSYGAAPEAPNNDTTVVAISPAFVTGEQFHYSIAAAFPNLAPGDSAGINVNHGGIGGSLDYYGVYMEYLRP
jgi:hypothetical protein